MPDRRFGRHATIANPLLDPLNQVPIAQQAAVRGKDRDIIGIELPVQLPLYAFELCQREVETISKPLEFHVGIAQRRNRDRRCEQRSTVDDVSQTLGDARTDWLPQQQHARCSLRPDARRRPGRTNARLPPQGL